MNRPPSLKPGDKVAVVCPASLVPGDISPAFAILREWGLVPIIAPSVTARYHNFAGNDDLRTADLQEALDNPDIKAIIFGRGGYGTVRIIDRLDFKKLQKSPKWIVGFSDITVLHSHIQRKYHVPTIHGQMVKSFLEASPESLETLRDTFFGKIDNLQYSYSDFAHRQGQGEGILIGGNLAILQSILGSPSDIKYDNKILFIEDVGEAHYNIDRMLWTLKRAKKLDKLQGLIVGGFTDLKDKPSNFGQSVEEIVMDKVKEYNYPVAFGCPAGHISDNRALVLGIEVRLKVQGNNVEIRYQEYS
jgi:muramoyltetrapeptide carboxypeptidase